MMVYAYVAITIAWTGIWHIFVQREIGFSPLQALRDIAPFLVAAATSMLATYYATQSITNIHLLLVARILMAALVYMGLMWLCGARIMRECLGFIINRKTSHQ